MKLNEKAFNIAVGFIVAGVIGYLVFTGKIEKDSVIGMFGAVGFNVILLLSLGFGLQYFQLGTDKDIQDEIFVEHNIAAAIYQVGIWIALAIVIAKGMM
jgi:uncharacterized membrane protein YjfL (UPF0719 family)